MRATNNAEHCLQNINQPHPHKNISLDGGTKDQSSPTILSVIVNAGGLGRLLQHQLPNKVFPPVPLRQLKKQIPILKLRFPTRVLMQTTRGQF